ncbi:MAG: lipopolysaccharide assembly protein LapB [Gammaproteobacteria bacterium]|jgi:lipopolysaccharide biosynthesis regulator YciM|nr:lipopolysaccharide assembly protein LapB [Gammaproteobacteria bacterium]MBT4606777.1 lipopolysaccharide assembly protein LapB [Thiotrichales bacterium]MBT3471435.1 lipopolysaccharide assembly protein LapB [Gammaproteobacteria bacterium]MBT3967792.1 lipopolysaccharide assembly protein LapB [Gammaproteobacteria bacterium]MBT4080513.1 lipopolysaccharide assembly protein LapB [Gammaproteobacteria bacterium]
MSGWLPYLGFLLLPVAAASGWWMAKRAEGESRHNTLSSDYFRGLNYLVNQEQERAIDLFSRLLEEAPELVETHLALGTLFRRQGDTSQAIQLHSNLVDSETLSSEQRALALLELGRDYMKAGLLDRAEQPFLDLVKMGQYAQEAYDYLVVIYQQEKEWDRAIEMLRSQQQTGRKNAPIIAQFLCEKAEIARVSTDLKEAAHLVDQALKEDPNAVRAMIIRAEIQATTGQVTQAIASYKSIEQQNASYIPNIIQPLLTHYRAVGEPEEVLEYLSVLLQTHPSTTVLLATVEQLQLMHGGRKAEQYLVTQLKQRPSVRGLEQLIQLNLTHAEEKGARDGLMGLQMLTKQLQEEKPEYQCGQCGFQAHHLHWQCPGCNRWNTIKPIVGVSGE